MKGLKGGGGLQKKSFHNGSGTGTKISPSLKMRGTRGSVKMPRLLLQLSYTLRSQHCHSVVQHLLTDNISLLFYGLKDVTRRAARTQKKEGIATFLYIVAQDRDLRLVDG